MSTAAMLPIEISVRAVHDMQSRHDPFFFLDCRQPAEYTIAQISGATLIPMHELPDRLEELSPHRASRIVVHCHHGGRSLRVAQWLREQGFQSAQSMAGGIDAWAQEIDPAVPRY